MLDNVKEAGMSCGIIDSCHNIVCDAGRVMLCYHNILLTLMYCMQAKAAS